MKYKYLSSLVRFIYTGECEVEQHDIEPFLLTAKDLKIEGLASDTEKESSVSSPSKWEMESTDLTDGAAQPKEEKCSNKLTSDFNVSTVKTEHFDNDKLDEKDVKNTLVCNECGVVEYCEASLKVHKRKKHTTETTDNKEPYMSRIKQNDIPNRTSKTLRERTREFNKFRGYVFSGTGKSLGEIIASKDGKEVVSEMVFSYFSSFRNKDGKIPKFSSLLIIRSSIKIQLIEAYGLDISNKDNFPEFKDKWLKIIEDLYADGMACKECRKQFKDIVSLKIHLENHSKESVIICKICETEFSRKWRLEKHMLNHVESNVGEL